MHIRSVKQTQVQRNTCFIGWVVCLCAGSDKPARPALAHVRGLFQDDNSVCAVHLCVGSGGQGSALHFLAAVNVDRCTSPIQHACRGLMAPLLIFFRPKKVPCCASLRRC